MEDVAATLMTDYHLEECQLVELWGYIFKKVRFQLSRELIQIRSNHLDQKN